MARFALFLGCIYALCFALTALCGVFEAEDGFGLVFSMPDWVVIQCNV